MYIHKNGITLIKIDNEDLEVLKNLKNESWFGTHTTSFVNTHDQNKWFNSLDSNNQIILKATSSNYFIGVYKISNINWINRSYDSAHDIIKEFRGRGFSKKVLEAGVDFGFEVLNMNRLNTEVIENNIASLKSALWVGFEKEGIKKEAVYKCNGYLDSIVLGIIRTNWIKLERVKNYNNLCNISYTPKNEK